MQGYTSTEYIKLFRKIIDWEWYKDVNTKVLFIHCLIRANWQPGEWQGVKYERGQFFTSIEKLAKETGLSFSKVRTALKHLILTGELTSTEYQKFRVITVVRFDEYQGLTSNLTSKSQANRKQLDKQIATVKEDKNIRRTEEYICASAPPKLEAEFEDIWKLYPRKQGKAKAWEYFVKAVDAGEDIEKIRDGVERYTTYVEADDIEQRFVKMGSTFFSQKSWLDEWTPKNRKKELDPEVKMLFTDLFAESEVI